MVRNVPEVDWRKERERKIDGNTEDESRAGQYQKWAAAAGGSKALGPIMSIWPHPNSTGTDSDR